MNYEAFIQLIKESPDDPGPLLVYSDWLEEQGQCDLAESIRLWHERNELMRRTVAAVEAADGSP